MTEMHLDLMSCGILRLCGLNVWDFVITNGNRLNE